MNTRKRIEEQLELLRIRSEQIELERQRLLQELAKHQDSFNRCEEEARQIAERMGDWKEDPLPFADSPLALLFLGAVSGEWAAQSRYRGDLPGFGGFLLIADGVKILIDPGRTTLKNLHAAGIHPRGIDYVVPTHGHWDCVRDLQLFVMAATETHVSTANAGQSRLRLLAPNTVLYGHPMDVEAVITDPFFRCPGPLSATRERLSKFATMNAPALNAYDLFVRLGGRFEALEIGRSYGLSSALEVRTRSSYHRDTFGVEGVAALDIVLRRDGAPPLRCVYLSDTEYRPELANTYAADLDELGPIGILICNVKTLDVRPQTTGPYLGFTQRHLGWRGVVQLTRDLRARRVLTSKSLVVLRAWGIETVTCLDPVDHVMTAAPEKLGIYEEAYVQATRQRAVVPGQTWIAAAGDAAGGVKVRHLRAPYPPRGSFQRFGGVYYCSEWMAEVVRNVQPAVEHSNELLLITGETGTGKDAIAKAIHFEAYRRGHLVIENSHALSIGIAYDQLVGHSRGAFTGAETDRDGWFTEAADGTLILQEIGDMPLEDQVMLLTILGERSYQRLGDHRRYELACQLIATTSRDIEALIAEGKLRAELVHRFQRRVHIPPLRERLEDIRAVAQAWHVADPNRVPLLEESAIALLQEYSWPGNVRSLENVFTRLAAGGAWSLDDLRREADVEHRTANGKPTTDPTAVLTPEERELFDLFEGAQPMRRSELEEKMSSPNKTTVNNRLKRLLARGLICKVGSGSTTRYQRVA